MLKLPPGPQARVVIPLALHPADFDFEEYSRHVMAREQDNEQ